MTSTAPTKYQDFGPLSEASLPLRPAPAASQEGLAGVSFAEGLRFPETKKPQAPKSSDLYPRFSNIVFAPNPDSDFYAGDSGASRSKDTSELAFLTRVGHRLSTYLATASISLGLLGESKGGLMTDANYSNPVKHQQHLDLGKSYEGTVVAFMWGANCRGSGVLVNNRRCVLIAAHEVEDSGRTFDPILDNLSINTGINYLTSPGLNIKVDSIIKHPSRTSPGVGTDLAMLILKHDLPGGIPAQISTTAPTVNTILDLVGYGKQATPNLGTLPITGDIIAGRAPVYSIDTKIETRFSKFSSLPLVYNAHNGDSGGGVFGSDRSLYGTVAQSSGISGTANTYSINLSLSQNYDWIQQIATATPAIPYVPSIAPELSCALISNSTFCLKMNTPCVQEGGNWVLQTSLNLQNWIDSTAVFAFSNSSGCYEYSTPIDTERKFFRLKWQSE